MKVVSCQQLRCLLPVLLFCFFENAVSSNFVLWIVRSTMCVWCCLMEHMFLFLYLHSYIHIHCSDFRFNGFSSCYRRYIAMVEMCQVAGNRDQLITLLLPLAEHVLNVILIHFQDGYDLFFSWWHIVVLFPFSNMCFSWQLYYPWYKCNHKSNYIRWQIWQWARHISVLWEVDSNIRKTWIA